MCLCSSGTHGKVGENMDDGHRKIWYSILTVVAVAVALGVFYWLTNPQQENSEGFLIQNTEVESCVI